MDSCEGRYSLVALKLHTGRTHQIRVHMLAIGHPLVYDKMYGEDRHRADREWCPRNFLHTYHLGFLDVPDGNDLADTGTANQAAVTDDGSVAGPYGLADAMVKHT